MSLAPIPVRLTRSAGVLLTRRGRSAAGRYGSLRRFALPQLRRYLPILGSLWRRNSKLNRRSRRRQRPLDTQGSRPELARLASERTRARAIRKVITGAVPVRYEERRGPISSTSIDSGGLASVSATSATGQCAVQRSGGYRNHFFGVGCSFCFNTQRRLSDEALTSLCWLVTDCRLRRRAA